MKYSALIGNPVEHSVSPLLFQYLASKKGIEYAHIKIKIDEKKDLSRKIDSLFNLGFCGINITCPYKKDIFEIVDEFKNGSEKIHSINVITKENNKICGYNTDGVAAIKAIEEERKITKDTKAIIFGAGGAAYAIFYELLKKTKKIVIVNEHLSVANTMVKDMNANCKTYSLDDLEGYQDYLLNSDLVINATSVGMHPNDDKTIIDPKLIKKVNKNALFFDAIFNPWETKFIKAAKNSNHLIVSGGYMLIYQAILALSIWANINVKLNDKELNDLVKLMRKEIKRING